MVRKADGDGCALPSREEEKPNPSIGTTPTHVHRDERDGSGNIYLKTIKKVEHHLNSETECRILDNLTKGSERQTPR